MEVGFVNTNFTGKVGHPDRPTDRPGYVPHLGGGASITGASRFIRVIWLCCATAGQTQRPFRALRICVPPQTHQGGLPPRTQG